MDLWPSSPATLYSCTMSVRPFIQSIYTSCTDSMNVCFNSFVWIYPNSHLIYLCAFYFYLREQKNRNKIIFAIINSIFNRQHSIGYDDDWFYVEKNLEAITINTSQIKKMDKEPRMESLTIKKYVFKNSWIFRKKKREQKKFNI